MVVMDVVMVVMVVVRMVMMMMMNWMRVVWAGMMDVVMIEMIVMIDFLIDRGLTHVSLMMMRTRNLLELLCWMMVVGVSV